jgi:nucleotide-binding universal stress UspA family protein
MMKTILVGYDGTIAAEQALARTAGLAQAFGSKVVVVSVAAPDPVPTISGAFGLAAYYYPAATEIARIDEAVWQKHREHVEAFFARPGVAVEFAAVSGRPVEEILDVADEHDVDLIVVGTREPGLLERLLAGSVSQGVARRARCDVLIVHAPEENG